MATDNRNLNDSILVSARLWQEQQVQMRDVMFAVGSLERTTKLLNSSIDKLLEPFNITFTRFTVLSRLYWTESGQLTLGEIAELLVVHPTSVTSAIDRLERDGFVRREPHPSDRRATLATITKSGRDLVRKATPHLLDARFGFNDIDDGTLEALTLVLRKVRKAAGDPVGPESEYRALFGPRKR
jgi:DNA-binding MarR family transcriptional regulator